MKKFKETPIVMGRYLVHNSGIELELVGGPYPNDKEFQKAIVATIVDHGDKEEDIYHMLIIDKGGISFSEFSNGFMEGMRERANQGG